MTTRRLVLTQYPPESVEEGPLDKAKIRAAVGVELPVITQMSYRPLLKQLIPNAAEAMSRMSTNPLCRY